MNDPCHPELLSRYLDDALTLPERRRVSTHVALCSSCQAELDALRRIDELLMAWGSRREAVPNGARARMTRSVERRRRLSPLLTASRMMPAAVGSSIAALLVLVSVNVGILYQGQAPSGAPAAYQTHAFVKQSRKLTDARRAAAIQGVVPLEAPIVVRHRTQFDFN